MKCPKCQSPVPWLQGLKGVSCEGCGSRVRNEIARWLIWAVIVDVVAIAAVFVAPGFWVGFGVVVVVGVVLWFMLDCRLDPFLDRYPEIRKYLD